MRVEDLIPVLELMVTAHLVFRIIRYTLAALIVSRLPQVAVLLTLQPKSVLAADCEFLRWDWVANVCLDFVQQLACFSAMRLLYYITPGVLATQLGVKAGIVRERMVQSRRMSEYITASWPLVKFGCTRLVAFVVGFEAFILKVRTFGKMLDKDTAGTDYGFASCMFNLVLLVVFLFQVLNVVNLPWFVQERLLIFIFGGEDGELSDEEELRWRIWRVLLTKRVYSILGGFQATIVMLGFDDYDFQLLVLDDKNKLEKQSSKNVTGCNHISRPVAKAMANDHIAQVFVQDSSDGHVMRELEDQEAGNGHGPLSV